MEELINQQRGKILYVLLTLSLICVAYYLGQQKNPAVENDAVTECVKVNTDNTQYFYEVSGQVNSPGVFTATSPKLVQQAIAEAGGLTSKADSTYVYRNIKLAVTIKPGEKIYIPATEELINSTLSISEDESKLNLNTASLAQLDAISGVGEVTANKIISARPFNDCSEIMNLPGVNSKVKEQLFSLCQL